MGGTSCDVCVVEAGRVRRTDSREIGGPPRPAADGRRAHGRRRRRLDRLARPRRRAAGRAALGRRRARPRLLRARRDRADGHRRQSAARQSRRRLAAGRGVELDAEAARAAVASARRLARPRRARDRGGDRPRSPTRRWSAPCAWSRSSAASTRATSRSCPSAAPGRCTPRRSPPSSASDDRLPAGRRRPLGARPLRVRARWDTARTVMLTGAAAARDAALGEVEALIAAGGERRRRGRAGLRDALRRPGLRAAGPGSPTQTADLIDRFEQPHRAALRTHDPDGEVVLAHIRLAMVVPDPATGLAAAENALGRGRPPGPLRRPGARRRSSAVSRRRRMLAGPPSSSCPRRPSSSPRWSARVDEAGSIVAAEE